MDSSLSPKPGEPGIPVLVQKRTNELLPSPALLLFHLHLWDEGRDPPTPQMALCFTESTVQVHGLWDFPFPKSSPPTTHFPSSIQWEVLHEQSLDSPSFHYRSASQHGRHGQCQRGWANSCLSLPLTVLRCWATMSSAPLMLLSLHKGENGRAFCIS